MKSWRVRGLRGSLDSGEIGNAHCSGIENAHPVVLAEGGYVYVSVRGKVLRKCPGGSTRLLGHISAVLQERNRLGGEIRRWWKDYLLNLDGPSHNNSSPDGFDASVVWVS
jgi:hypothetical protein